MTAADAVASSEALACKERLVGSCRISANFVEEWLSTLDLLANNVGHRARIVGRAGPGWSEIQH
jgi:hypothetical protein